jgi:hypothetical protein
MASTCWASRRYRAELVQARDGKAVADVVQPRGSFQQIGVSAENGCQAVCPGGDALGPAARDGFLGNVRATCSAREASVYRGPG